MVKMKVVKNTDGNVSKSALSKVQQSKVKKSKKKFGAVPSFEKNDVQNNGVSKAGISKVQNGKVKKRRKKKKRNTERRSGKNTSNVQNVAQPANSKGRKSVKAAVDEETENAPPLTRWSDAPAPKKVLWTNRQRVLVLSSRGIGARDRHLMRDLRKLLPHSKADTKMERKENLSVMNEVCEMKHCNKCILFEGRGYRDVYMWISNVHIGPSVKFLLQNIYTMDELKFTGNCLVGSRPLLSFDENFEEILHYRMIKELLTQIFGVPNHHPKSQPFFDHVFTFSVLDNRIWFRNYQIMSEDGALVEIGPRFLMNPVKIFDGSFGGETLWENPRYVTPAKVRQMVKKSSSGKYVNRLNQKVNQEKTRGQVSYKLPETDGVFTGNMWERAKELVSKNTEVGGPLKEKKRKKKVRKSKGKPASSQSWTVQAAES